MSVSFTSRSGLAGCNSLRETAMPLPQSLELSPVEFDVVAAFLQGFHAATCGGLLEGFREWLVVKLDHGSNVAWSQLALNLAFPDAASPRHCLSENGGQQRAVEVLFGLLEEYWQAKESLHGLRGIYVKYQQWLQRQDWYGPSSPDYIASETRPAGQDVPHLVSRRKKRA
jgi:hypothetical protein